MADFDGDGRPDLVTCSYLGIFLHFDDGGAPNFGAPVSLTGDAGAPYCNELVVVDLDGDGNIDLADIEDTGLVTRLGFGDGGFSSPRAYSITGGGGLTTSDINADGRPDLVWASPAGIGFRLNQGGGELGPEVDAMGPQQGNWTESLTVADLNGDGLPDLATAAGPDCDYDAGGGAWVFFNDGDGGFTIGVALATDQNVVIHGITAWRPAGAALSSLVVGHLCDGNVEIFPNLGPDGG